MKKKILAKAIDAGHWQMGERAAVRACVAYGRDHGYGNLIDRLRVAWALMLMTGAHPLPVYSAWLAAGLERDRLRDYNKAEIVAWCKAYAGEDCP
ncbi:MAG: hypothetical protein IMZ50_01850 [Candidatus Atribacteria bacterium]|nr:hypothetical protein [Candidatus Atribacteria bacterium]